MRESPVASEKIAVDQASRRPQARVSTPASIGRAAGGARATEPRAWPSARGFFRAVLWYDRRCPRLRGRFHAMPNIKQQRKRVRTAARERLENLRYRSTVKTLTKRLRAAVEDGDEARIADERRELQRWIDRAAARGALHRNTAARKKAQADRLTARSG